MQHNSTGISDAAARRIAGWEIRDGMGYFSMIKKNIFENIPSETPDELVEIISETRDIKIERIVSKGHSSDSESWYDQDKNEYVLLIGGSAGLRFEGEKEILIMKPGDYVTIPAHMKHRVEWTDPGQETIWLAVYY